MHDGVLSIFIEEVQLGEETELFSIAYIVIVFVHWPKEAIFLCTATSIETIAEMSCKNIVSSSEAVSQIVADILYGAVVVGPFIV